MKYSRLIKNRISTSRNQRKCFPSLLFLQKYILSRRSVFALIEALIIDAIVNEIAIVSTIIAEEFESRSVLLFARNSINSRFFLKQRFSILIFLKLLFKTFFRTFEFFEINSLKLISKSRRSEIYLFRFDKVFDIIATISLFL